MFLQLLLNNGQPVYIRPEDISGLAGYHDTHHGAPKIATRVILKNRDVFFVQGCVDKIHEEVVRFTEEHGPKLIGATLSECRCRADGSPLICKEGPCEHDPKPKPVSPAFDPVHGV